MCMTSMATAGFSYHEGVYQVKMTIFQQANRHECVLDDNGKITVIDFSHVDKSRRATIVWALVKWRNAGFVGYPVLA